jgi:hypothetical protein
MLIVIILWGIFVKLKEANILGSRVHIKEKFLSVVADIWK